MNVNESMKSGFSIERQLGSVKMSDHEHSAALRDARIGRTLVHAIVQAFEKFARRRADAFMKRGVYYWD